MKRIFLLPLTAAAVWCAMPVHADEPVETDSMTPDSMKLYELQQIEVTATRVDRKTPVAYADIGREAISRRNFGSDMPTLLQMTPSVVATSDAGNGIGGTAFRLRGSDASRINVTTNGVPMNDAESHSVYWYDTPDMASSVGTIQVQRGAGTSTNGTGAFGGSVNMTTAPMSSEFSGEASLSYGSYNTNKQSLQIGAGLMGVLYILDEPSIGLHQRDNDRLIHTLERLRDQGNTVIVVEHDEDTIRAADYVLDMGPGAGELGGQVVAAGTPDEICACPESTTGAYLTGRRLIRVPRERRNPGRGALKIVGASHNNLKNVTASIEFGTLTVVTGVSGSGKSSLVTDTIAPALTNAVHHSQRPVGEYKKISGIEQIDKVIDIDQSPIGRTPRSNPATYIGLWDDLRALFASTPESRARGYSAGRFSFNVSGGRCEACKGDGQIKIEMNFLPDVYVPCEVCHGARYNRETLEVTYHGKNISQVLDMSVTEALKFFANIPRIKRKLQTLYDVGLGYIRLGQPATTLSGGEAQRVKLAKELHRQQTGRTFYILDEPTTGLHFEDVRQLLDVLQRLVDAGNTVLVIEHNLDVIKVADRLIDMGPEGGDGGGTVVCSGTPEQVAACPESYTGKFLGPVLARTRELQERLEKSGEPEWVPPIAMPGEEDLDG